MIKLRHFIPRTVAIVLVLYGLLYVVTSVTVAIGKTGIADGLEHIDQYVDLTSRRHLSGAAGVFFGLFLIVVGRGLYACYRRSWWTAVVTLAVMCGNSFWQGVWRMGYASLALLVVLVASTRLFHSRPTHSRTPAQAMIAWFSLCAAITYGTVGSYLLRDHYYNLKTWTDAIYYTVVTFGTVGYGDITPRTQNAKFFTVSMIVVGLGAFVTAVTVVVGPLIEDRLKGVLNIMKRFGDTTHHVIICGYTAIAKSLIERFQESGQAFIVIEDDPVRVDEITAQGYRHVQGSSAEKATFQNANLRRARAVVACFDSDADNILTVLTVEEFFGRDDKGRPKIIARIDSQENVQKARNLGVDEIVSPAVMAAQSIVEMCGAKKAEPKEDRPSP